MCKLTCVIETYLSWDHSASFSLGILPVHALVWILTLLMLQDGRISQVVLRVFAQLLGDSENICFTLLGLFL